MNWLAVTVGGLAALVPLSYLVDRLRARPVRPERLPWAPEIPIRQLDLDGVAERYIVVGEGPTIVLLHTLRTQLDMFQRLIPELATRFRSMRSTTPDMATPTFREPTTPPNSSFRRWGASWTGSAWRTPPWSASPSVE